MKDFLRLLLVLLVTGLALAARPAGAQTIVTLGSGFQAPGAIAVDPSGNVFVADGVTFGIYEIMAAGGYVEVKLLVTLANGGAVDIAVDGNDNLFVLYNGSALEYVAAGGYTTVNVLGNDAFQAAGGIAVDANGNVFIADTNNNGVREIPAAANYANVITLGSDFYTPLDVAVDASGNVFVADTGHDAVKEILAVDGSIPPVPTIVTLGSGIRVPLSLTVDGSDNVYLVSSPFSTLSKFPAQGGYAAATSLGSGFENLRNVAVDNSGNIFVTDAGTQAVKEILATPPTLMASVLPGSRSVGPGIPATVFATMINSGTAALDGCQIALPVTAPAGLTLSYQTTDRATNALTGTPDTPVTIPGNDGAQSFLLTFQGTSAFTAPILPPDFSCTGAAPAAVIQGVDTVDLTVSATPVADIIVLAATPSGDGIIAVPDGGSAAFATASTNLGAAAPISVTADTGDAFLPVTATFVRDRSAERPMPGPARCVGLAGLRQPSRTDLLGLPAIERRNSLRPSLLARLRALRGCQRRATRLGQRGDRERVTVADGLVGRGERGGLVRSV
ncbi:MAG: NHL repeat-containing protein [Aliidongia sp.]